MKTRYYIRIWKWNENEYEPILQEAKNKEEAEKKYKEITVSNERPQIELIRQTKNKYGYILNEETIKIKD